jgi:hypothetical protein
MTRLPTWTRGSKGAHRPGQHRAGARPPKPASYLIPAEWLTRSSDHILTGPASPMEDFFPTLILPMPQPVSPASSQHLHDWAVA